MGFRKAKKIQLNNGMDFTKENPYRIPGGLDPLQA